MGAQGSKSQDTTDAEGAQVADYYKILEVDEDATQDQIKKSFRRLALIHHPDKNQDNVEEANKQFAAIQQAYEVLSDEQERAWYDSHKASLVPEPDAQTVFEDIKKGAPPSRARDRGLTVNHLAQFVDPSIWSGFNDGEDGFYTIYRNLFARLAAEEAMVSTSDLPSFGSSDWTWVPAHKGGRCVREFYNSWLNFVTAKDFAWQDRWNLVEAPDRRVRRLMEKDNKKARDEARKEYNDTIRSLVQFIRKRDPRYKAHLAQQAAQSNQISESGRTTPNAASQRQQQLAEQYVEQDWQKVDNKHAYADLEWAVAEGKDDELWECVVCGKSFRSEAAWDSHERSKKHIKEVEKLKWQMQKENDELDLGGESEDLDGGMQATETSGQLSLDDDEADEVAQSTSPMPPHSTIEQESQNVDQPKPIKSETKTKERPKQALRSVDSKRNSWEGGPAFRSSKLLDVDQSEGLSLRKGSPEVAESSSPNARDSSELSKMDRRRARQARKAEGAKAQSQFSCNVCNESFESRSKLFSHVREEGHAQAEVFPSDDVRHPKTKKGKRR